MKIITKLAVASVLALSAAPAFAASVIDNTAPEALTQLERNTYLFTPDARPIAHGTQHAQVRAHRALDAFAQASVTADDRFSVANQ